MSRPAPLARQTLLGDRAARRIAVALIAGALSTLLIGRHSDIDLLLADAVFDAASNTFPWRDAWLTDTFGHVILKRLLTLAALGFIGCAVVDAFQPLPRLCGLGRLRLRIVASSAILVPAVISLLKQLSSSHCPWDLARYGGEQPYVRIFDILPAGAIPGHCLPAGHASSALWLLSLAVYWLPAQARAARVTAFLGITAGSLLGFLQQLRGAHFLTHTLWSLWIASATVVLVILVLQGRQAGGGVCCPPAPAATEKRRTPEPETDISESS